MSLIRPSAPEDPLQLEGWREQWLAAKAIDGLAGEWTYPVFMHRAARFHRFWRDHFYERLSGIDQLLDIVALNANLFDGGVPVRLANQLQVVIRMFRGVFDAPRGRVPMPLPGETSIGNHAMQVVGWDDDSLVVQNSWKDWGDEGLGYLSREYCVEHLVESWGSRALGVGFTPRTWEDALGDPARSWVTGHRRGSDDTVADNLTVRWFEVVFLSTGRLGMVLFVEDDKQRRLGWAHYCFGYEQNEGKTLLMTELFVWPPYRGRGLGRLLLGIARGDATDWEADELRIVCQEGDLATAESELRETAHHFGGRWEPAPSWSGAAHVVFDLP